MTQIWNWLAGKKTYGAAALLFFVAIAGWWTSAIDDVGFGILFALALAIAGFRDAAGRHLKLVLEELRAIKEVTADRKVTGEELVQLSSPVVDAVANELVRRERLAQPVSMEHSVPGATQTFLTAPSSSSPDSGFRVPEVKS